MEYRQEYERSLAAPEEFWLQAAQDVAWHSEPKRAYDPQKERWFADGTLNVCENAIDRHVASGKGDEAALIFESPVSGVSESFTFAELQDHVARMAGMIANSGVTLGDRVIIYMPMVPEAVFAMLACARIGAVHSVVFGGFSAAELAKRIDDCEPRLVLTASCGLEGTKVVPYAPIVSDAISRSHYKPSATIMLQRPQHTADLRAYGFEDWETSLASAPALGCVPVSGDHPLYVLYTSGTTGKPKGVVRDSAGYCVALNWSMRSVYGVSEGEAFWAASDVGWVVGHSYIVYGPLIAGCATVLYEGKPIGTPDAGAFWRIVDQHSVSVLFTAPTAIRAIRGADPTGSMIANANLDSLKALFLAGERADPDTVRWIGAQLDKPVIDHWWQTELGWPALASCFGIGAELAPMGSAGFPVPGFDFDVLDAGGNPVEKGQSGNLVIRKPLPPGAMIQLWQNAEGYLGYFSVFRDAYATGDAALCDDDGSFTILGRTDDIINVAGHRLSTGAIEETVANCSAVIECAVIGARDALKGEVPIVVYVASSDDDTSRTARATQIKQAVRRDISPIASPKAVIEVKSLPKTRSGKILRNLLRALVNGDCFEMPQTIDDPRVVSLLEEELKPPKM